MKGKVWTLAELCALPSNKVDARKVGSEWYYTGRGCTHGHLLSPQSTAKGECLHCKRGRQVEYLRRSETAKEYNRRYTLIKYYEKRLETLLTKSA